MNFACPRCQARLSLPAGQMPTEGARARCPKCLESFIIKPRRAEPRGPAPPGRRPRTAEEQELLDRLGAKRGQAEARPPSPDDPGEVVVLPEPAPRYALYGLAVALMAAGVLGFFFHAFQAAGKLPEPQKTQPPPQPPLSYEERGLAADLAAMRRDFRRRQGLYRKIDYRGREERVFKYIIARLAPEACGGDFSGLRLWSTDTRAGFKALGTCRDENLTAPELEINWQGEKITAGLGGASLEIISIDRGASSP